MATLGERQFQPHPYEPTYSENIEDFGYPTKTQYAYWMHASDRGRSREGTIRDTPTPVGFRKYGFEKESSEIPDINTRRSIVERKPTKIEVETKDERKEDRYSGKSSGGKAADAGKSFGGTLLTPMQPLIDYIESQEGEAVDYLNEPLLESHETTSYCSFMGIPTVTTTIRARTEHTIITSTETEGPHRRDTTITQYVTKPKKKNANNK